MKKERIFIFWLLAIIIALVLLVFLKPQETINNIIQAIAIITLIFVTWVYAKRTGDLVEQERASLEEGKKKRNADFAEKYFQQYYLPFKYKLFKIQNFIKRKTDLEQAHNEFGEISDIIPDISYLHTAFAFLNTAETLNATKELIPALSIYVGIIGNKKREEFEGARQSILEKIQILDQSLDNEISILQDKIAEVYRFFNYETMKKEGKS